MIDLKKMSFFLNYYMATAHAYEMDGTLDRSYAKGQMQKECRCKAVVMQPDGKMLVAGYVQMPGKKMFAVARLLQNGVR